MSPCLQAASGRPTVARRAVFLFAVVVLEALCAEPKLHRVLVKAQVLPPLVEAATAGDSAAVRSYAAKVPRLSFIPPSSFPLFLSLWRAPPSPPLPVEECRCLGRERVAAN
eukprot:SAG22_NODE_1999_length_3178_cov_12.473530_3_plen_111_part_00